MERKNFVEFKEMIEELTHYGECDLCIFRMESDGAMFKCNAQCTNIDEEWDKYNEDRPEEPIEEEEPEEDEEEPIGLTEEHFEELLEEVVNDLDEYTTLAVWNTYCDDNCYDEERIYDMSDFDDFASGYSPMELVENLDDFTTCDDYFVNGSYGFHSISDIYDVVDDSTIVEYLLNDLYANDFEDFENDEDIKEEIEKWIKNRF